VVEVSYTWIGTEHSVLPAQQRYLAGVARTILGQLREACPMAVDQIECAVEGIGAGKSTACGR